MTTYKHYFDTNKFGNITLEITRNGEWNAEYTSTDKTQTKESFIEEFKDEVLKQTEGQIILG